MRERWIQLPLPGFYEGYTAVLPPGLRHGKPSAYNRYKCRCPRCKAWRNSYDRATWGIRNRQQKRNEKRQS